MTLQVPWNASWSAEEKYEIRPCRYCDGQLAIWMPHKPGEGRPLFAKPHMVRQRQSIARYLCTVCGQVTKTNDDRWWFALGDWRDGYFLTTEAPVHRKCADLALELCPHLIRTGAARYLQRWPRNARVLSAIVGGEATERDFAPVKISGRRVIGHLKFGWPKDEVQMKDFPK